MTKMHSLHKDMWDSNIQQLQNMYTNCQRSHGASLHHTFISDTVNMFSTDIIPYNLCCAGEWLDG